MTDRETLISNARAMRKEPSRSEQAMWNALRDHRLDGIKFRRQHPVAGYVADFACVKAKLIVELDGPSHTTTSQIAYDQVRTAKLEALGWRVLRLSDDEVTSLPRAALDKIRAALGLSPSP